MKTFKDNPGFVMKKAREIQARVQDTNRITPEDIGILLAARSTKQHETSIIRLINTFPSDPFAGIAQYIHSVARIRDDVAARFYQRYLAEGMTLRPETAARELALAARLKNPELLDAFLNTKFSEAAITSYPDHVNILEAIKSTRDPKCGNILLKCLEANLDRIQDPGNIQLYTALAQSGLNDNPKPLLVLLVLTGDGLAASTMEAISKNTAGKNEYAPMFTDSAHARFMRMSYLRKWRCDRLISLSMRDIRREDAKSSAVVHQ